MPDLRDGESIEVPGSTGTYTIKNVGGVYACNCMAWRTQSLPVDRRTCKHIRKLRGDAAEDVRTGAAPAPKPAAPKPTPAPLPVAVPAVRLPAPQDTEAVVLEYHASNGRFAGFRCRLGDGQTVAVTAGFADRDRDCPPPVGGIVTLRFQQVTATGLPVAASFAGVRPNEAETLPLPPKPRGP
ncbi:MAG: dependent ligase-like protein [Gemmataceae bacterium]|nr:dependent ligase-like protein [Gemmataceae bacterium]